MIWRASLDTRNFSFEAYADDEAGARRALRAGLDEHCRQTGMVTEAFMREFRDGIEARPIKLGQAYRDREALPPLPAPPCLTLELTREQIRALRELADVYLATRVEFSPHLRELRAILLEATK